MIKHSGERHEKDDSSRIGNRSNYILGWDNIAKIAAIEAELDLVNRDLNELNKQIKSLEKKRKQRQQQQSWRQALMNFTDFTEIDWRNTEQEKQKLVRDLEELEASSDRLKINNLNKSLREIDYIDLTYIELRYQKSRDRQINDFRNNLKTCLGDVTRQIAPWL